MLMFNVKWDVVTVAVSLCNRQDPHTIHYNQKAMCHHLASCLSVSSLTPFPTEERPRRVRKKWVVYEQQNLIPVYCLCRMPWNKDDIVKDPMVWCSNCKEWYRQLCVRIKSSILRDR